jgi:hypothetical protein
VLVTDDGGRDWRDTGRLATGVSALSGDATLAFVDGGEAPGDLALTLSAGRTWIELEPPQQLQSGGLIGAAGWVTDLTSAAALLSTDGGVGWQAGPPMPDVHANPVAIQPGLIAALDPTTSGVRYA